MKEYNKCCPKCGSFSWSVIIHYSSSKGKKVRVTDFTVDDKMNCTNCDWSGLEKELISSNVFLRRQKALIRKQKLNKLNGE